MTRTEAVAADLLNRLRELLGNAGEIGRGFDDCEAAASEATIEHLSDAIWRRLDAAARAEVVGILQALSRIQAGQYGICDVCRDPIPTDLMHALPTATVCLVCKTWERGDA